MLGKEGWAAPRLKDAVISESKMRECYFEVSFLPSQTLYCSNCLPRLCLENSPYHDATAYGFYMSLWSSNLKCKQLLPKHKESLVDCSGLHAGNPSCKEV